MSGVPPHERARKSLEARIANEEVSAFLDPLHQAQHRAAHLTGLVRSPNVGRAVGDLASLYYQTRVVYSQLCATRGPAPMSGRMVDVDRAFQALLAQLEALQAEASGALDGRAVPTSRAEPTNAIARRADSEGNGRQTRN